MKKIHVFLGLVFMVGIFTAGILQMGCNSNTAAPVLAAAPTKAPTATPTGCAGTIRGNNDVAPSNTMAMASGDVVSIPISIVGATAVNHLSLYFQDTGTLSPFPASDVLETALYSVNGAGTKATLVSGTGSTLLISSNIAAGWVTVGIGNVSLSKNTQYLLLAQYIQDGGNGGNSQVVNIGNNGGVTTATALITASYMTNSPIEITAPGSSWTLPAAGTNGYELNVTTCP